jgi:hypothetical protein
MTGSSSRWAGRRAHFGATCRQEFQQRLFEEAVMFQGEAFRQPLAIYLHDRHERTTDALKAEAVPEPDSLGG